MADTETMTGIASGLAALDATMRNAHKTGGPGTGIFYLLDNLAVSTLGVPRTPFPLPVDPTTDTTAGPVPAENA